MKPTIILDETLTIQGPMALDYLSCYTLVQVAPENFKAAFLCDNFCYSVFSWIIVLGEFFVHPKDLVVIIIELHCKYELSVIF